MAPLRDHTFDLLQIGVGTGASLRTWREWFTGAQLVGLDARRLALDPPVTNCTLVHGRQTDLAVLQPLVRNHRFRLIVDDGSRHPEDQVQTFLTLFPWLESDSVYICAGCGDNSSIPPQAEPDQDAERSERPAAFVKRPLRRAEQPLGVEWFAELGQALTAGNVRRCHTLERPVREFILSKATGVLFLRGSVMVTS